jgi:hypothetical protein
VRQPRHAKQLLFDFDFVDCGKCAAKTARKSPYRRAKSDPTPQVARCHWFTVIIKLGLRCGETEKVLWTFAHHHYAPKKWALSNADRFRVVGHSIESHALLLRADAVNDYWDFRLSLVMAQEMKARDTVAVHTISHSPHP